MLRGSAHLEMLLDTTRSCALNDAEVCLNSPVLRHRELDVACGRTLLC
jgi:hypothetical protein